MMWEANVSVSIEIMLQVAELAEDPTTAKTSNAIQILFQKQQLTQAPPPILVEQMNFICLLVRAVAAKRLT